MIIWGYGIFNLIMYYVCLTLVNGSTRFTIIYLELQSAMRCFAPMNEVHPLIFIMLLFPTEFSSLLRINIQYYTLEYSFQIMIYRPRTLKQSRVKYLYE